MSGETSRAIGVATSSSMKEFSKLCVDGGVSFQDHWMGMGLFVGGRAIYCSSDRDGVSGIYWNNWPGYTRFISDAEVDAWYWPTTEKIQLSKIDGGFADKTKGASL